MKDILIEFGFIKGHDDLLYYILPSGSELWYIKDKMFIAGSDCPNEHYATEIKCDSLQELQEIIIILTRTHE